MNFLELFKEKAEFVTCKIFECEKVEEAFPYIIEVAKSKSPCELYDDKENVEKGSLSQNNLPTRLRPLIACPDLDAEQYKAFAELCQSKDIDCVQANLRKHLAGIDIGITKAKLGLAETGSCLIDTTNDDIRLATMIAEIHVIILEKSSIKPTLLSCADDLRELMNENLASNSLFVTGPSRTSDIERVVAIGVHGPLEVHIILLES